VESETAMATNRCQDARTAIMQELNDMTTAQSIGETTRQPETSFEAMLNTIEHSLSHLASSEEEQDGQDEEDDENDTELGKLSDDDEPCWVTRTIPKTEQHCIVSWWQRRMRLGKLSQPGWGDAANHFCERDMRNETGKARVPAVGTPPIDTTSGTPLPTTFRKHMKFLCIVHGQ